ncbi:MAG: AsmA-like C-terminal region-containing protein [Acidobacteriaceae bacterium]
MHQNADGQRAIHTGRIWKWLGISLLLSVVVLAIIAEIVLRHAGPILKGRVIETLSTRFDSKVELDTLDVSLLHGLQVTGGGLRIYPPDDVIAAGATQPLIAVQHFDFRAGVMGLFIKPMHVSSVHVSGLDIHIPPKEYRQQASGRPKKYGGKIKIIVGEILCDDSQLIIGTAKPGKDPKDFVLKHIVMRDVGGDAAWPYDATLTNAIPRGNIHAVGTFGPWNLESPGDSPVTGNYTFDHADLGTIHGIGGILSSTGKFTGQLNRIDVNGQADVPAFTLDTANHPVSLKTQFHAIVDGTSGDTSLEPVQATLGESKFTCSGSVVNVKGKGHIIDLDIDIPAGQIQDFLNLAVKTQPPVMSGALNMKAKLHIPPGKESVTQKIGVRGHFVLTNIHFSNPDVEDKVDMLSLRAQGKPGEAHPGAPDVHSQMRGAFDLHSGRMDISELDYTLPGASVQLAGEYTLDGKKFDFTGKVRTDAKLSQMTSTWWKSLLLKPVDPFFHKHGAGAEIPVKISGTNTSPKFGLDMGGKK